MMARCSRCKTESFPLHRRKGFLNCEPCLAELHGGFKAKNFINDIWGSLRDLVGRVVEKFKGVKPVRADKPQLSRTTNFSVRAQLSTHRYARQKVV